MNISIYYDIETGEIINDYHENKHLFIKIKSQKYAKEEREKLWTIKLDQEIRYIEGKKIDVSTDEGIKLYEKALEEARKNNIKMGYGKIDWDSEIYKKSIKKIKYLTKQLHNKK